MKVWLHWMLSVGLVFALQGCEIKTTPDFKFTGSGSLELDGATYDVTFAQANLDKNGDMQFNFNIQDERDPAVQITFEGKDKAAFEQLRVNNSGLFSCAQTYFKVLYVRHGATDLLCQPNETSSNFFVYIDKDTHGLYQVSTNGYTGNPQHTLQNLNVQGIGFNDQ